MEVSSIRSEIVQLFLKKIVQLFLKKIVELFLFKIRGSCMEMSTKHDRSICLIHWIHLNSNRIIETDDKLAIRTYEFFPLERENVLTKCMN